ncbi:collagen alpha-1(I) chain-like [Aquila chrysaetos chrysaetos]|uniref:collagen alpha-1(I) chain-like n=1 Tax=Aquila chrysaetos chrysaetos TaxID=223781 RepID=UPI00117656E8|nr:collagen alpha-1(I) chain-like [Aquila chrysaetos chrysaetos]
MGGGEGGRGGRRFRRGPGPPPTPPPGAVRRAGGRGPREGAPGRAPPRSVIHPFPPALRVPTGADGAALSSLLLGPRPRLGPADAGNRAGTPGPRSPPPDTSPALDPPTPADPGGRAPRRSRGAGGGGGGETTGAALPHGGRIPPRRPQASGRRCAATPAFPAPRFWAERWGFWQGVPPPPPSPRWRGTQAAGWPPPLGARRGPREPVGAAEPATPWRRAGREPGPAGSTRLGRGRGRRRPPKPGSPHRARLILAPSCRAWKAAKLGAATAAASQHRCGSAAVRHGAAPAVPPLCPAPGGVGFTLAELGPGLAAVLSAAAPLAPRCW